MDEDVDLIERLEREWRALASGPQLRAHLRAWTHEEPILAATQTPAQLLRRLRELRGRHQAEDEILAALLRQAGADSLAARVVLQALLPGLKNLAGRTLLEADERDELWAAVLAHAWEKIRGYPLERRPRRIAANLLLDTLKAVTRERKTWRPRREQPHPRPHSIAAPPAQVDGDVDRLLARAIAAGALSNEEAQLILQTRIDGVDLQALAAELQVPYNTLNVRRLRAERRLLVFLGKRERSAVTFRQRKRPLSSAQATRGGRADSNSGGGADRQTPTAKEVTGAR